MPTKSYYLVSPSGYGGAGFGLTYHSERTLAAGQFVMAPVGRRQALAVVMEPVAKPEFATREVAIVEGLPLLPLQLVSLAKWLAEYYAANAANVWQTMLPAGLTRKRRAPKAKEAHFSSPKTSHRLSDEQTAAIATINSGKQTGYVLHGITGSGKTEIYLRLAATMLAAGRSVIVLVPEIMLTPQIIAAFEANFGPVIIATHSGLTEAERHLAWLEAASSTGPRIAIGPRSSLFLPVPNPGLIIVDECHESSYKQEQAPRYNAITAAARLAQLYSAKLVLGSATPGLTELYWARHGRLGLLELTSRTNQQPLPVSRIIDLRDKSLSGRSRLLSEPLLKALDQTLADGRQALLFINRRGSASSQICADCGRVSLCPNCRLPLTFHADVMRLICHYCNFRIAPVAVCPVADGGCGSPNLRFLGGGTKRIESEIGRLYPTARLARLDRDSLTATYLQQVYKGLHDGTIDILIGTQMIAKGLDLPNLDVVGVVSADTMLHVPDFTAAERTFNLLTQVSGRAGRGQRPGQVLIQTYSPLHPAITAASRHDYQAFAEAELAERRILAYPPYVFLLKLSCQMVSSEAAHTKAEGLAGELRNQKLTVLGPAPAFIEQAGGQFHWQVIVKAYRRGDLVSIARDLPSGWTADLDPINLL